MLSVKKVQKVILYAHTRSFTPIREALRSIREEAFHLCAHSFGANLDRKRHEFRTPCISLPGIRCADGKW